MEPATREPAPIMKSPPRSPSLISWVARVWRAAAVLTAATGTASALADTPTGDRELLAWWSFDRIDERATADSVAASNDSIGGNFKAVAGVLGKAVKFDGFTTEIVRPAAAAPKVGKSFTLEAWVALGAYPWNWCQLVNQGRELHAG